MVLTLITIALSFLLLVSAETHTVRFENNCGYGTPTLIKGGTVLSTGEDYTVNDVFSSAIAYLQNDDTCGFNGENCTLVELSLQNPTVPGSGSSSDLSLIAPHKFSVTTGIRYFDGCDTIGTVCDSPICSTAFFQPDDTWVQIACQEDNVNLLITFCDDSNGSGSSSSSTMTSHSPKTTGAPTPSATPDTSPSSSSSSSVASSTASLSSLVGTASNRKSCKNGSKRRRARADHARKSSHHKRRMSAHH